MSDVPNDFGHREFKVLFATKPSNKFDVLEAKLEELKRQMGCQLNADLFRVVASEPAKPLTRRERLNLRWYRIRGYFSTLWLAVKGEDPYDGSDW